MYVSAVELSVMIGSVRTEIPGAEFSLSECLTSMDKRSLQSVLLDTVAVVSSFHSQLGVFLCKDAVLSRDKMIQTV